MDVHLEVVIVRARKRRGRIRVESDGRVSHNGDVRSVVCVVARIEGTSQISAEEDSQRRGGGAHYADLEFELRPDEEVEGGSGHVSRVAGVFERELVKGQSTSLSLGLSLLISQYVRMQLAITTMRPSEKITFSAIFCLLGIA